MIGSSLLACQEESIKESPLFELLESEQTNITFVNQLEQSEAFNTYIFRNFYNGAGVALGDVNKDGLTDIYFAGNTADNALYLNKGDFQFEDITDKAGVSCPDVWSTGVSMADVNGDGWLDIYVCKSGPPGGPNRYNELFINQQDGTFKEEAKTWRIADEGLSVHAIFFDYDKDSDLDMYLLNNSLRSIGTGSDLSQSNREVRDLEGGNKLYRNEGTYFVDVSEAAGIYGSNIGFGLGVTIGDVNKDGWQDIFVSNDFFEKDYLYINQQNGTFQEDLESYMREISLGSMGADMADLNNDTYPEIFVTEMLPERDDRYKTKAVFENWETYQRKIQNGYYQQFGRNVLQLNNANGTFSEIGRLANVEASDWSWGALIFDMNADGRKDLFVANGIYKDLVDQDYVNFYSNPEVVRELIRTEENAILTMVEAMPSEALPNYAFIQKESDSSFPEFENLADSLGLGQASFSNGSVYGDLDNDGDLDLVVSNVNMPPFVYENHSKEKFQPNTLSIELKGEGQNTYGLGAQITLYAEGENFYQELAPMRGFQSCVESRLHFGLGKISQIDSVIILWNSLKVSKLENVLTNQLLSISESEAQNNTPFNNNKNTNWFQGSTTNFPFRHRENQFSDFNRDRLLMQMLSNEGPKVATADVNGDGLQDVFVCGAKDQSSALFLQQRSGNFIFKKQTAFEDDLLSEDTDATFFDADNDGDQDLYVTSGGNEFPSSSSALVDRLYFNDGNGNFERSKQTLPGFKFESSSCVAAADFDGDGDQDLAVGIRLQPFLYGVPMSVYLLENDGKGKFKNVSPQKAPDLKELGLITDLAWLDVDKDGDQDLMVTGEWMSVQLLLNENGNLKLDNNFAGSSKAGFWHCLEVADVDGDGDQDVVLGNMGKNTRLKANDENPLRLYINDFDQNGSVEQILTQQIDGKDSPWTLRNDLIMQLPHLKKKYLKFESYQSQSISDIFTETELTNTLILEINTLENALLLNDGNGNFEWQALPIEAQSSPIYAIEIADFNADGQQDILLGGNFYRSKPEMGIYDASYGVLLQGDGNGKFSFVPNRESNLMIKGEVRDFVVLSDGRLLVARNNEEVKMYVYDR